MFDDVLTSIFFNDMINVDFKIVLIADYHIMHLVIVFNPREIIQYIYSNIGIKRIYKYIHVKFLFWFSILLMVINTNSNLISELRHFIYLELITNKLID